MYIVAITRWGRPLTQELGELSQLLGVQPYDLRIRLAGDPPVIVGRLSGADEARDLLQKLRDRGHGAVACDGEKLLGSDRMATPKSFELAGDAMTVDEPGRPPETVPYGDLLALVHAQIETETHVTTTTESRKFSAGRALMTGGLILTEKVSRESRDRQFEHEQVLYVFRRSTSHPLILRQSSLRYSRLGTEAGHSSTENFAILVRKLRELAPEALYDNRLLKKRRRTMPERSVKNQPGAIQNQSVATASSSNAGETDLAAYLIALAHHGGQG